ncbi:hypothetical protein SUGI_0621340 [Cryptomeria japonica]|uniref:uncharacterized protein LOC131072189 n=1 Tax=Cryptomeria japonica TaxID=3369 RepID=UPI002414A197|nr:uncharacterized protein LOC131072189 [Cryptomeria japonica]GLJ31050.1 hypothetical protein SUGI_0621340 [Cryptomeria japonica]
MVDLEEGVSVGTRGTIGSLMTKELEYLRRTKSQPRDARKLQCGAVSVFCEQSCSLKRPQTEGEKKSSRNQRPCLLKCRSQGREMADVRKKRVKSRKSVSDMEERGNGYEMPMLDWQRGEESRSRKSGFSFVDVVDLKCTNNVYSFSHDSDKSWGLTAIASRFMKRLSFSRLSV